MKDGTFTADRLVALYDRVADAEDAIPRLRRFVLDLAVRGKLVEQDPSDEPAAELLKRIAKRTRDRIKAGDFKEPKSFSAIDRSTLPFDCPKVWSWVRLIEIAEVSYGFAFDSARFNDRKQGVPLIRIRDISSSDTVAYFDGAFDPFYVVKKSDFLVGMDGDFNVRKWAGDDALLNQRVMRMRNWSAEALPDYVALPLQFILSHLHGKTSQTTVKHLSAKQVNGIKIALPPLAEQQRIVAKVDELMALCDRLEAARAGREAVRDRLTAVTLSRLTTPETDAETFPTHARFALQTLPTLTTRPDQIKTLRQTILNLAVRGKLVEQDPNDEPAAELLKRLLIERKALESRNAILRVKKIPEIKSPMFRPPNGWLWCPLVQICDIVDPNPSHRMPQYVSEGGFPFISSQNFADCDGINYTIGKRVTEQTIEEQTQRFSILDGAFGFSRIGTIGKTRPLKPERDYGISHAVCVINPVSAYDLSMRFLRLSMTSELVLSHAHNGVQSVGVPDLGMGVIRSMAIPLPPLAEQHRIVAKVDTLMALCDQLEASLITATTTRSRLLEATLHAALAGGSQAA
ncbi:restriction endonuclease subunit S [Paracoccus hibiscisoli]|uniref:Type I restriction modification DNA specificity domain-containing protein n=1 Tax=Paracoccus hibiscisoli TaxID=2023261 RepID=A0A4U0R1A2_9RHOB|nr:restriction endonuclease subunit S [Paracoccus hibiscisoli]TJZ82004.1 hypothetical protein FA740_15700 [Paracoccus hibiscisoli]